MEGVRAPGRGGAGAVGMREQQQLELWLGQLGDGQGRPQGADAGGLQGRQGHGHLLHGQGHVRRAEGVGQALQPEVRQARGSRPRSSSSRSRPTSSATSSSSASARSRASATSSSPTSIWTRGVRRAEVADGHDGLHQAAARASSSRRRCSRSTSAASTSASRRPRTRASSTTATDKVPKAPRDLAGRSTRRPRPRAASSTRARSYEGLTVDFLELAFARRRPGARPPTARRPMIDSPQNLKALQFMVDGIKTGAAPEGRHDLHGGGGPARLRVRQARRRCATGPTPTRWAQKSKVARSSPCRAAAGLPGRRQGRHPRRPQRGDLGLQQEPQGGRCCSPTSSRARRSRSSDAAKYSLAPTLEQTYADPAVQQGAAVLGRAQAGRPAGQGPPGLAGLSADLRGDLQERQRGPVRVRCPRRHALKKAQSDINKALQHVLGRLTRMEAATATAPTAPRGGAREVSPSAASRPTWSRRRSS